MCEREHVVSPTAYTIHYQITPNLTLLIFKRACLDRYGACLHSPSTSEVEEKARGFLILVQAGLPKSLPFTNKTKNKEKQKKNPWYGITCLQFQHLGSRGQKDQEFKVTLSSCLECLRPVWVGYKTLYLKGQPQTLNKRLRMELGWQGAYLACTES